MLEFYSYPDDVWYSAAFNGGSVDGRTHRFEFPWDGVITERKGVVVDELTDEQRAELNRAILATFGFDSSKLRFLNMCIAGQRPNFGGAGHIVVSPRTSNQRMRDANKMLNKLMETSGIPESERVAQWHAGLAEQQ